MHKSTQLTPLRRLVNFQPNRRTPAPGIAPGRSCPLLLGNVGHHRKSRKFRIFHEFSKIWATLRRAQTLLLLKNVDKCSKPLQPRATGAEGVYEVALHFVGKSGENFVVVF